MYLIHLDQYPHKNDIIPHVFQVQSHEQILDHALQQEVFHIASLQPM